MQEELSPAQVAAIVGSLLMQEQMDEEQRRRRPIGGSDGAETSRWRDAGRREILRRL